MSDFFEKRGGRNPLDPFRGGFLTKKGREKRKKNPFGKKEEQSPSAILGELVHGIVQGEFARRGVLGAAEALLVDIPRGMNSKVDAIMASGEIVEIKSVSLRELKGMTAPRPEHAAQALYYLSQIKTSVQDFATVLYVAREAPGVRKAFRVYPGGRHEQVDQMATNYMVERRGGVSDSKFNFSMTGGVEEQVSNEGLKSEFFDKMAEYRRQRRIVYDRLEKQGRDKAYRLATAGLREENDVKGFGDGLAGALRLEWGSAWKGKELSEPLWVQKNGAFGTKNIGGWEHDIYGGEGVSYYSDKNASSSFSLRRSWVIPSEEALEALGNKEVEAFSMSGSFSEMKHGGRSHLANADARMIFNSRLSSNRSVSGRLYSPEIRMLSRELTGWVNPETAKSFGEIIHVDPLEEGFESIRDKFKGREGTYLLNMRDPETMAGFQAAFDESPEAARRFAEENFPKKLEISEASLKRSKQALKDAVEKKTPAPWYASKKAFEKFGESLNVNEKWMVAAEALEASEFEVAKTSAQLGDSSVPYNARKEFSRALKSRSESTGLVEENFVNSLPVRDTDELRAKKILEKRQSLPEYKKTKGLLEKAAKAKDNIYDLLTSGGGKAGLKSEATLQKKLNVLNEFIEGFGAERLAFLEKVDPFGEIPASAGDFGDWELDLHWLRNINEIEKPFEAKGAYFKKNAEILRQEGILFEEKDYSKFRKLNKNANRNHLYRNEGKKRIVSNLPVREVSSSTSTVRENLVKEGPLLSSNSAVKEVRSSRKARPFSATRFEKEKLSFGEEFEGIKEQRRERERRAEEERRFAEEERRFKEEEKRRAEEERRRVAEEEKTKEIQKRIEEREKLEKERELAEEQERLAQKEKLRQEEEARRKAQTEALERQKALEKAEAEALERENLAKKLETNKPIQKVSSVVAEAPPPIKEAPLLSSNAPIEEVSRKKRSAFFTRAPQKKYRLSRFQARSNLDELLPETREALEKGDFKYLKDIRSHRSKERGKLIGPVARVRYADDVKSIWAHSSTNVRHWSGLRDFCKIGDPLCFSDLSKRLFQPGDDAPLSLVFRGKADRVWETDIWSKPVEDGKKLVETLVHQSRKRHMIEAWFRPNQGELIGLMMSSRYNGEPIPKALIEEDRLFRQSVLGREIFVVDFEDENQLKKMNAFFKEGGRSADLPYHEIKSQEEYHKVLLRSIEKRSGMDTGYDGVSPEEIYDFEDQFKNREKRILDYTKILEEDKAIISSNSVAEEVSSVVAEAPPPIKEAPLLSSNAPVEEVSSVVAEAPPPIKEAPLLSSNAPIQKVSSVVAEAPPPIKEAPLLSSNAPIQKVSSVVAEAPPPIKEAPLLSSNAPIQKVSSVVAEAPPPIKEAPLLSSNAPIQKVSSVVAEAPPPIKEAPLLSSNAPIQKVSSVVAEAPPPMNSKPNPRARSAEQKPQSRWFRKEEDSRGRRKKGIYRLAGEEDEEFSRREERYRRSEERRRRGRGPVEKGNPSHHVLIDDPDFGPSGKERITDEARIAAAERRNKLREYLKKNASRSQWTLPTLDETREFLSKPLTPESSFEFTRKYQFIHKGFDNGRVLYSEPNYPFEYDIKKWQDGGLSKEEAHLKVGRRLLLKEQRRWEREAEHLKKKKEKTLERGRSRLSELETRLNHTRDPNVKKRIQKYIDEFQMPSVEEYNEKLREVGELFDEESKTSFPRVRERESLLDAKEREDRLAKIFKSEKEIAEKEAIKRAAKDSKAKNAAFKLSLHVADPSAERGTLPLVENLKDLSYHEKKASRRRNFKGRFDFFINKIKESGSSKHLELQIESDLLRYAQDLEIESMSGEFGFEPLNGGKTPLKDTSYFKDRVLRIRKELKKDDLEIFQERVGSQALPSGSPMPSAELDLLRTEEKWKRISEAKRWARSNPLSDELPERIKREKEKILARKNRRRKRNSRAIHPDARELIKKNVVDFIGETTIEQELKKPRLNSGLDPKKLYTLFDIETTISRSKSRLPFFTEFAATQIEGSEIFGKELGDLVKTGSERSSRLTAALPEEGLVNRILKAKNIDQIFEERPGHVLNQEYKKGELQKATQRFLRAQSHTNPIDAAKTPDLLSFVQSEMREIADTHMKRDRGRWVYSDSMASKIESGKVSTTGSLDVLYGEQEKITRRTLDFFEKTQKAHGSLNLVGHNIESFDIPMLQSFFKQEGLDKGVELLKNSETVDTLRGKAFRSMFDRINLISAGEHGELMTTLTTKIEKGGRKESIRTLSNLAYSIGAIDSTEFSKAHSADFDVARASLPVFQFLETADDDQIKKMMSTFVNLSKDQAQGVSFEESAAMIASIEGAESLEKKQNLKLAQELLDSNTESKTKILESSGNLSEQTHARAPQRAAAWDELPKKQPMISGLMDDLMKLDAKAVETFQTAREGASILKRELSEAMAITVDMIEDQGEKIFEKMSGPLERIGIQKNALRFTRGKTMAAMGFVGIGGIVGLAALGSGIAGSVKPSRPPMAPKSRPMFHAQDFSADDEKHKMIRDEGSVAKMMRQENTDFGSGYRGVVGSGKALAEASSNTPGMLKSISSQASSPLKKSGIVHLDGVDEMSNLRIATNKRAPETVDFSSDLRVENTPQFDLRMKLHSDKINRKKKFKDVAEESSKMAFMSDFNKIRHHL